MEIVRLTKERLSDFQNLYIEFFKELRGKQGFIYEEESYRKEAETYFKRGDLIFLAYDREPAGFIRLSSREGCFWIEELFVRPDFRGRGIGRALVERAEKEVKKHDDALYLFVLPQDKDAIAFWKKLGYAVINTNSFSSFMKRFSSAVNLSFFQRKILNLSPRSSNDVEVILPQCWFQVLHNQSQEERNEGRVFEARYQSFREVD